MRNVPRAVTQGFMLIIHNTLQITNWEKQNKKPFFHGSYLWDRIFNCIYTKAFQSSVRLLTWICSMVCKSCQNFRVSRLKAHKAHCFMSYIYLDFRWDKKTLKWSIINVIFHDGYEYSQVCKHASFEMKVNFVWPLLRCAFATTNILQTEVSGTSDDAFFRLP